MVIDPFAGTCSTGVSALRSGSFFVGCDYDDPIQVHVASLSNSLHLCCGERGASMLELTQRPGQDWLDLQVKNGDQGSVLKVDYVL